ncbi:MAG TPA: YihY/virulence factor BrkB family protein [Nitrolancea sp.]|nr:YihY/virulence factor BrkB family protein [Nitrolancea sp.]
MSTHSSPQSPVVKAKRAAEAIEQHVNRWKITPLAKALVQRFSKDNTTGLAAQVAYNLMFAIPPLLIFLLTLAALVDHVTGVPVAQDLHTAITQHAPGDTKALLDNMVNNAIARVDGKAASIGLIVTVFLALWGGSNGIGSLIQAFNSAYEVTEDRSFIQAIVMRIVLTVLLVVVIIGAFVLFVFGQKLGVLIANHLGLGSVFNLLWNILRWPAAIVLFMFLLALLYYWGPNVEQSFRWVSPGSVVAAVLWFIAVLGFKLYVTLSNPGSAYGAAGSVIVLLFFLYVTGIIFILGAQVNAELGKRYDPETIDDLATHPEKTTADEARHDGHGLGVEREQ